MTEENKIEIKEEKTCFCQSKWFKKFLVKALAVFVGTFCALSLFAALHKPPMPPCPFAKGPMMRPAMHCHHHHYGHYRGHRGDFQRKFDKNFEGKEFQKRPPVRVNVETDK